MNEHLDYIKNINQSNVVLEEVTDRQTLTELCALSNELSDDSNKRSFKLNQIPSANKENVQLRRFTGIQSKHHAGKIKIEFIENGLERAKTKSSRRPTLIKKVIQLMLAFDNVMQALSILSQYNRLKS